MGSDFDYCYQILDNLTFTTAVAETEKLFDQLGRVTDIVHERAATELADYDLDWDAASRITDFDFESLVGDNGDADYWYDDTNQLTGSDYASDWQTDESYVYDDNGNRTLVDGSTPYTTGDHNRLTSDGTYAYEYDNEGNRTARFVDNDSSGTLNSGDTSITEYEWDHRNRATKVTTRDTYGGAATKIVEYAYDFGQRWFRKTLDTNGDGTIESSRIFVHDNGQIVLDFQKAGTSAASNADLANRYLWGTNVDELLTDELVDDGTEDDNRWALTDHLNTVRDLVVYDPITATVSVVKHVTYDAFGNVTNDSATGVKILFLYTARPLDSDTVLQNNLNRWYDLSTGRWMSTDPSGFAAEDANLYRYVGNLPLDTTDPTGLWKRKGFAHVRDGYEGWGVAECETDREELAKLAFLVTGHPSDWPLIVYDGFYDNAHHYDVKKLLMMNEFRIRLNIRAEKDRFRAFFISSYVTLSLNAAQINSYFGGGSSQPVDCLGAVKILQGKGVVDTLLWGEFDQLFTLSSLPIRRTKLKPSKIGDRGYIENNRGYKEKHPKGPYPGENVIMVGQNTYWGF